jgi:hypothetical protein
MLLTLMTFFVPSSRTLATTVPVLGSAQIVGAGRQQVK